MLDQVNKKTIRLTLVLTLLANLSFAQSVPVPLSTKKVQESEQAKKKAEEDKTNAETALTLERQNKDTLKATLQTENQKLTERLKQLEQKLNKSIAKTKQQEQEKLVVIPKKERPQPENLQVAVKPTINKSVTNPKPTEIEQSKPDITEGLQHEKLIDSRYQISNNDAEVKDLKTGLIWQRCRVGKIWTRGNCDNDGNQGFSFDDAQELTSDTWRRRK